MIIKKLRISNFRQFVGTQEISFSYDKDKKATLVIAENTSGKTTIIECFSWILYGTTKLKSILNSLKKDQMQSGDIELISGEIELTHLSKDYVISRTQKFAKSGNGIKTDDSVLKVNFKDNKGISKELRGMDAEKEVETIVPQSLFPYFFFKGEQIEKIGREINDLKPKKNNEFVTAIKNMLGFSWLYQTRDDLKSLSNQYGDEIASNQTDGKLASLVNEEKRASDDINKYEIEIDNIINEISYLSKRKEELNQLLIKSGDIGSKQQESKELERKCQELKSEIKILKKRLFDNFSVDAYSLFCDQLIEDAIVMVDNIGDIDKGIPGLEASAIEYLLKNKRCLCGTPLIEGSEEYKKLEELEKFLPPNNIGHEITLFKISAENTLEKSSRCYDVLLNNRKILSSKINNYNMYVNKLNKINAEIQNYDDVSKLKEEEIQCSKKIDLLNQNQGRTERDLQQAKNNLERIQKERSNYTITDNRNRKLNDCQWHVNALISRIDKYCAKKEGEKRMQLQKAINSIYSEIFKQGIYIELDENYSIKKIGDQKLDLSDFEDSTSQDAITAFSFIGGMIKLAKEKILSNNADEELVNLDSEEPYPLVMDAPSSSFDINRIESFCELMPKIAEQVIFFIKDTDGLYVKKYLENTIGKEYVFEKQDAYTTIIKEK